MNIFSLVYDPTTSSPFLAIVEQQDNTKSYFGLSEQGRQWAEFASEQKQLPSRMISTGFAPYTKSAQELIEPAMAGEVALSLEDVRSHIYPEMVYAGRTINRPHSKKPNRSFSISSMPNGNKPGVADYLAQKFILSLNTESVIREAKSENISFSSKTNYLTSTNEDPGKAWLMDRVGAFLGRGLSRRMGEKVNSGNNNNYSENNRINRRVKSLIGNVEIDIREYPLVERINFSGIERFRR